MCITGLKAAAAASEAVQQEREESLPGAAVLASNKKLKHDAAVSFEAAAEESRPPKKRRHISVNLPASHDEAAGSAAAVQESEAQDAGKALADTDDGRDAIDNIGRRGQRRKQAMSKEADVSRRVSDEGKRSSQEEYLAQLEEAPVPSPGLKVKLKRQKH